LTRVELYTDAGIKEGAGTWATVIVREGFEPVEDSGVLRGRFGSSTAVEVAAIANAIHVARKRGMVERGDVVTVRTDNTNAVARIMRTASERAIRKGDPMITRATEAALALAEAAGITLLAEWVKGHQPLKSTDPHAPFNRRCDVLCRQARAADPVKRAAARKVYGRAAPATLPPGASPVRRLPSSFR
jgi:ribonuclease HI